MVERIKNFSRGLRNWFELFEGILVYEAGPDGYRIDEWFDLDDIELRFKSGAIYNGTPYSSIRAFELIDAISSWAGYCVQYGLLERRYGPGLDLHYRVTKFGRRVGHWGHGSNVKLRKLLLFFGISLTVHIKSYIQHSKIKTILIIGSAGWLVLNAFRFYSTAFDWAGSLPFAAWSASIVAAAVVVWHIIFRPR